jgi:hypothetical protein
MEVTGSNQQRLGRKEKNKVVRGVEERGSKG